MKLIIDPIRCDGRGTCAELLPELVELDEWGFPIIRDPSVSPSVRRSARRAVAICPTLALRLERSSSG